MSALPSPAGLRHVSGNVRFLIPLAVALFVFGGTLWFLGRDAESPIPEAPESTGPPGDPASAATTGPATREASSNSATTDLSAIGIADASAVLHRGSVRHASTLEPLEGVQVELRLGGHRVFPYEHRTYDLSCRHR